jgi:hypothetical protein
MGFMTGGDPRRLRRDPRVILASAVLMLVLDLAIQQVLRQGSDGLGGIMNPEVLAR